MKALLSLLAMTLAATSLRAEIVTRRVEYVHDGVTLEGYLAYDASLSSKGKLPGVLVVHEWWGLNDYVRHRAEQLAGLGYVAFALDMYGKGKLATTVEGAKAYSGQFYGKPLMAERARAGLDQLLATGLVDSSKVAAIGYCFGGSTVQALAYSGAPLAGIVSFHGGLLPADAGAVSRNKAKILVCHGAADPSLKREQIDAYLKSLDDGKVDYRFVQYAGALHAFTNPDADAVAARTGLTGFIGYSPSADRRSWQDMKDFLAEIFGG